MCDFTVFIIMKNLINDIRNTGYIENKKIGMFFHIKYPKLFKEIYEKTKIIETTYVVNTTLRARVIFLLKYNNNLNLLKNENNWLTFDRKHDDFIKKSLNSAKTGWNNKIDKLNKVEIFSLEETIEKLKNLSDNEIYGKSTNRKLMNKNPKLFKSIFYYSSSLNGLNRPTKTYPSRILFVRDFDANMENLKCEICENNYCFFSNEKKQFNKVCRSCFFQKSFKYPQKEWFEKKYGDKWEIYYDIDRKKLRELKVNSQKWFNEKYGDFANYYRNEYINSQIDRISNIKTKRVSKISQDLFWSIYDNLKDKNDCYFNELNKEIFIRDNEQIYFPDFVYKDKIIEYDGKYWHNDIKDEKRNNFYNKLGYKLLIINSDEYNIKKKPKEVVEKCLKFLLNEN